MSMASPPSPSAPPTVRSRRRPDFVLLLVGGIFALYIVLNVAMFWFATSTSGDLVSRDYYARSKRYDEVIAARAASRATGWRVAAAPLAGGAISFVVTDRNGAPVTGLQGTVRAYRPNDAGLDQQLSVTERAGQPGTYDSRFLRPAPGLWSLTLQLAQGGQRLHETLRVVLP